MNHPSAFNEDRARSYDARIVKHIPGYDVLHALCETFLAAELPEHASLLVGGIGTGKEIVDWAPKHSGWTFTGIDPSEAMIGIAREKLATASLAERVTLKVGNLVDLPEEPFDAATLLLVLHFVPDNGQKEELLSAVADRLKPGAPFLMATMFGDPETTRYKRLLALTKRWAIAQGMDTQKAEELCDPARQDLFAVPEERIKSLLRNAGFIDAQRLYQALRIGLWAARTPR